MLEKMEDQKEDKTGEAFSKLQEELAKLGLETSASLETAMRNIDRQEVALTDSNRPETASENEPAKKQVAESKAVIPKGSPNPSEVAGQEGQPKDEPENKLGKSKPIKPIEINLLPKKPGVFDRFRRKEGEKGTGVKEETEAMETERVEKEAEELGKELAEKSEEEQEEIKLGFRNFGFFARKLKSDSLARLFEWGSSAIQSEKPATFEEVEILINALGKIRDEAVTEEEFEKILEKNRTGGKNWTSLLLSALGESYKKDADLAKRKIVSVEERKKSKKARKAEAEDEKDKNKPKDQSWLRGAALTFSNIGQELGMLAKVGRTVGDVVGFTTFMPLRYVMMGTMAFARGAGAGKEARLASETVKEKSRVENIEKAAEEAWAIYDGELEKATGSKIADAEDDQGRMSKREQALAKILEKEKISEGMDDEKNKARKNLVSGKALQKAYNEKLPGSIAECLAKEAKPGDTTNFLEKLAKKYVVMSAVSVQKKLDKVEKSELSEEEKKTEREAIVRRYEGRLKDLDRMVSDAGTVDALAFGLKMAEGVGKTAVLGMTAQTLYHAIAKSWETFIPRLMSADLVKEYAPKTIQKFLGVTQKEISQDQIIESFTKTFGVDDGVLSPDEIKLGLSQIKTSDSKTADFLAAHFEKNPPVGDSLPDISADEKGADTLFRSIDQDREMTNAEFLKAKSAIERLQNQGETGIADQIRAAHGPQLEMWEKIKSIPALKNDTSFKIDLDGKITRINPGGYQGTYQFNNKGDLLFTRMGNDVPNYILKVNSSSEVWASSAPDDLNNILPEPDKNLPAPADETAGSGVENKNTAVRAAIKTTATASAEKSGGAMLTSGADPIIEQINLATVDKGEGIEHALQRQLSAGPGKWGFAGDLNDEKAVKSWAGHTAHRIALKNGYVNPDTGQEVRIRDIGPAGKEGNPAYVLEKSGDDIVVKEYLGGKATGGEGNLNDHEYFYDKEASVPVKTSSGLPSQEDGGASASKIYPKLSMEPSGAGKTTSAFSHPEETAGAGKNEVLKIKPYSESEAANYPLGRTGSAYIPHKGDTPDDIKAMEEQQTVYESRRTGSEAHEAMQARGAGREGEIDLGADEDKHGSAGGNREEIPDFPKADLVKNKSDGGISGADALFKEINQDSMMTHSELLKARAAIDQALNQKNQALADQIKNAYKPQLEAWEKLEKIPTLKNDTPSFRIGLDGKITRIGSDGLKQTYQFNSKGDLLYTGVEDRREIGNISEVYEATQAGGAGREGEIDLGADKDKHGASGAREDKIPEFPKTDPEGRSLSLIDKGGEVTAKDGVKITFIYRDGKVVSYNNTSTPKTATDQQVNSIINRDQFSKLKYTDGAAQNARIMANELIHQKMILDALENKSSAEAEFVKKTIKKMAEQGERSLGNIFKEELLLDPNKKLEDIVNLTANAPVPETLPSVQFSADHWQDYFLSPSLKVTEEHFAQFARNVAGDSSSGLLRSVLKEIYPGVKTGDMPELIDDYKKFISKYGENFREQLKIDEKKGRFEDVKKGIAKLLEVAQKYQEPSAPPHQIPISPDTRIWPDRP